MRRGQQPQHETFNPHDVVVYDIETVVAESDTPADGSFPPWPRHRPVGAAFLRARWTTAGYEFTLKTLMCAAGEEVDFYEEVERQLPANVTAVTFNGRGFDNRVLAIHAMKHAPGFGLTGLARQAFAGRFDGAHCDLADQFGGMGGARPVALAEICRALDVPIKTSTSGADVGVLWAAGQYQAIRDYVREDVLATYLCWLHFIAFIKSDEALLTLPLAELAAWVEAEPGLAHLKPFADCRPARCPHPRTGAAHGCGVEGCRAACRAGARRRSLRRRSVQPVLNGRAPPDHLHQRHPVAGVAGGAMTRVLKERHDLLSPFAKLHRHDRRVGRHLGIR